MHLFAVASCKRAVVDAKCHCDGRRIDWLRLNRGINGQRADGICNCRFVHTGKGNDIACHGLVDVLHLQTTKRLNLGDAELFNFLANTAEGLNACADLQFPAFDTAGQNTADKWIAAQCCGQHPEIFILLCDLTRGRDVVHNKIEQGRQILAWAVQLCICPT